MYQFVSDFITNSLSRIDKTFYEQKLIFGQSYG